jgi:hypothetical protein
MRSIRTSKFAIFSASFKNGLLRFECGFASGLPHLHSPTVSPTRTTVCRKWLEKTFARPHSPVVPSTSSRSKSACPLCRAYSSIM